MAQTGGDHGFCPGMCPEGNAQGLSDIRLHMLTFDHSPQQTPH